MSRDFEQYSKFIELAEKDNDGALKYLRGSMMAGLLFCPGHVVVAMAKTYADCFKDHGNVVSDEIYNRDQAHLEELLDEATHDSV